MTVRRFMSVAAVLAAAGLVLAQGQPPNEQPKKDAPAKKEPAKPAPGSLEDTLEKALRNSADIKAAESKVRDAEAELNRVRQQVLTRATALHTDLNLSKRMLAVAENALTAANNRTAKVGPDGSTDAITARTDAILAAEAMVAKHRGEVEKLEAELKSIRGEFAIKAVNTNFLEVITVDPLGAYFSGKTLSTPLHFLDPNTIYLGGIQRDPYLNLAAGPAKAAAVQAPMAERIRKLLDQEVDLQFEGAEIPEMVETLLRLANADIPLRATLPKKEVVAVNLKGKLPVGAWIQAIEDSDSQVRIVVRDYGLLLTTRDRVPEGALRVQDLWKGNYAELKKPDAKK